MTDTIIKGTGNSRLLKSVPNLRSLIPAGGDIVDLLIGSGLPVDLSGPQAAGVDVMGTDYSKANCLSDATASAIGSLGTDPTINQALSRLRSLITTAQNTANKGLFVETGTYTGTNSYSNKTIYFSTGEPRLVLIYQNGNTSGSGTPLSAYLYLHPWDGPIGNGSYFTYRGDNANDRVIWGTNYATFGNTSSSTTTNINSTNVKYRYFAITQK